MRLQTHFKNQLCRTNRSNQNTTRATPNQHKPTRIKDTQLNKTSRLLREQVHNRNNIDQHKDFEQTLTDTNAYNTLLQRYCTSTKQKQKINELFRDTLQKLFIARLKNEGYTDHYISLGNSQQPIISTDKTTIHFLKPPTGKPIAVKQTKTNLTKEYETITRFQDITKNPPTNLIQHNS